MHSSILHFYVTLPTCVLFSLTIGVLCDNDTLPIDTPVYNTNTSNETGVFERYNSTHGLNYTQGKKGRGIFKLLGLLKPPGFFPFGPIRDAIGLSVVVQTSYGRIRGIKKISRSGRKYWEFAGIPYARPPLDNLRFEPPQEHPGWSYVRSGNVFGAPCVQAIKRGLIIGNEDCLTLNIASHISSRDKLLPVMVFIHGGYFMTGASNFYPPWYFMDEEVILVTINYRLSALGFLNTGDSTVTGNMGLKDQSLALKWIKENIINFNGDPEKILIFGESAGSASVHLHILSPMSRRLFSRAISQSGTALSPWAINRDPKGQSQEFANAFGCNNSDTKAMISCLRKISAKEFGRFDQDHVARYGSGKNHIFKPSVEVNSPDPFLNKMPLEILKSGDFSKVPFITGVNSGEGLLYMIPIVQNSTLRDFVNKNWPQIGKFLFNLNEFSSDPDALISTLTEFYMKKLPISKENLKEIVPFMSDAGFFLDNHDAALLHSKVAPTYIYHYNYSGIFALGEIFFKKTSLPIGGTLNGLLGGGISLVSSNLLNRRAENPYGVCHGDELALLFNVPLARKPIIWTDADHAFSKKFVALWVSFAESGEPQISKAGEHGFKWEPVKNTNAGLEDVALTRLDMNDKFSLVKEPFFDRLKFWKEHGVTHV